MNEQEIAFTDDTDAPMRAALEAGLAFLPDLVVRRVQAGFAVSTAAYVFEDSDRCAAYAMRGEGDTWTVEDSGDLFGWRCELKAPGVQELIRKAGAREDDFTLVIGPLAPAAVPAAITHMLALVETLANIGTGDE